MPIIALNLSGDYTGDEPDAIQKALDQIVDHVAAHAFVPQYIRTDNLDERRIQALGMIIAQWSGWDGGQIFGVMCAALEDANFHPEVEAFQQIWNNDLIEV